MHYGLRLRGRGCRPDGYGRCYTYFDMGVRPLALALWMAASIFAAEQDDITYRTLVQRVKSGDFSIDFRALRVACIKSSQCEPRSTADDLSVLNQAMADHRFQAAADLAERLIDEGFANMEVHADCVAIYKGLNHLEKSQFHLNVVTGMLGSIMASGDGRTKETAFEVTYTREEWITLSAKGLPYVGSGIVGVSQVTDGPHRYSRWEVLSPKTGQTVVVWFQTDLVSRVKDGAHRK